VGRGGVVMRGCWVEGVGLRGEERLDPSWPASAARPHQCGRVEVEAVLWFGLGLWWRALCCGGLFGSCLWLRFAELGQPAKGRSSMRSLKRCVCVCVCVCVYVCVDCASSGWVSLQKGGSAKRK